jgi:hypothetical protein
MALHIWPISPPPADMDRQPFWNDAVYKYDSGARQGVTNRAKPFMRYSFSLRNMERTKQSSLFAFWNTLKGRTEPFLFMDPYDNRVNSTVCADSGFSGTSFYIFDQNSFMVIPQSGSIVITSTLSGTLPNSWYVLDQDTGIIVRSGAKDTADVWTASCAYFKKVAFEQQYGENSNLWNNFNAQVVFEELW